MKENLYLSEALFLYIKEDNFVEILSIIVYFIVMCLFLIIFINEFNSSKNKLKTNSIFVGIFLVINILIYFYYYNLKEDRLVSSKKQLMYELNEDIDKLKLFYFFKKTIENRNNINEMDNVDFNIKKELEETCFFSIQEKSILFYFELKPLNYIKIEIPLISFNDLETKKINDFLNKIIEDRKIYGYEIYLLKKEIEKIPTKETFNRKTEAEKKEIKKMLDKIVN